MEGWIKIHRQIKEHWIWDDPVYLKAWLGILLTVNHEDKKILIQGELIECKRGQSILSLAGWVKCFGKKWTMQRIRTFFELLKRDQMIITEGLRKTTRLTVCNYDNYQFEQQAKNKQRTSRQHPDNILTTTNKNEEELIKNEKNEKKFIAPALLEVESYFEEKGYKKEVAKRAWMGYDAAGWNDSKGKPVLNWKQKMVNVWFSEENKISNIKNASFMTPAFQLSAEDDLEYKQLKEKTYGNPV